MFKGLSEAFQRPFKNLLKVFQRPVAWHASGLASGLFVQMLIKGPEACCSKAFQRPRNKPCKGFLKAFERKFEGLSQAFRSVLQAFQRYLTGPLKAF